MDDIIQQEDSSDSEFKPLPQRVQECLNIESEDAIVLKIQACLKDVIANNKRNSATKKSQWYTW